MNNELKNKWKDYSIDSLNLEYDIQVGDAIPAIEDYEKRSNEIIRQHDCVLDVQYLRNHERQVLDLFVPDNDEISPVLVFIHGGYWHHNSKDTRRFPAAEYEKHGIAWAPINYRLVPEVSMDEIAFDVRSAIAWIYENAEANGCDRDRIYVCGNSAGGHLTAMLMATGWQSSFNLPDNVVKGGCAISGLFDLEPLIHTRLNEWFNMDNEMAQRNSPVNNLPDPKYPLIITYGSEESDEFKRQSEHYWNYLNDIRCPVTRFSMQGEDHFTIIGKIADSESRLFQEIIKMINTSS